MADVYWQLLRLAEILLDAVQLSKDVLNNIYFEGMYFRNDIGYEFES